MNGHVAFFFFFRGKLLDGHQSGLTRLDRKTLLREVARFHIAEGIADSGYVFGSAFPCAAGRRISAPKAGAKDS